MRARLSVGRNLHPRFYFCRLGYRRRVWAIGWLRVCVELDMRPRGLR